MYTIDKNLIANGIPGTLLATLIKKHQTEIERCKMLLQYYLGRHAILNRTLSDPGLPNNKMVCNFAKYITTMASGYLLGVPVEYKPDKGVKIEAVQDAYYKQTISNVDSELAKEVSIYGYANELVYANEDSEPCSVNLSPLESFLVCDDTVEHAKLFAVHFYSIMKIDGTVSHNVVNVYTENKILSYKTAGTDYVTVNAPASDDSGQDHFFGAVPFIEYKNNAEYQGDFEQVMSLIDAYEILQSDRLNDKQQLVDALLVIINASLNKEDYKLIKEQRGLELPEGSDAKYLTKQLTETEVEVLKKSIAEDIHRFSQVPNMTDETFAGNLSGVAIRYKLFGFDQLIKDKERFFETGLMERFELYNRFLNVKSNAPIVATTDVSAVFSRNLPVNNLEISQMVANLKDTLSDKTLIRLCTPLDSSINPDEELKTLQDQRKEASANTAASFGIPNNQPADQLPE